MMTISRLLLTTGLSCLTVLSAAGAGSIVPTGSAGAVVAEVDGVKLTAADLERKRPSALVQARNTYYQAERKVVEDYIDDYLLERQAEKEHLTVAQLLDKHVNAALPKDPSEEALQVFYEGANAKEPFQAVRVQILEQIRQGRKDKLKAAYIASLRSQSNIAVKLDAPRVKIALKGAPVRGKSDAPVTIVEYADYECPYCQQIQPTLDKLEKDFQGKVAFAYKDVPLPMHATAEKAAEATHCAEDQGKYWEYHDLLFASKQLGVPALKEHAQAMKLDTDKFNQCLDSGAKAGLVKEQLGEAQGLQLQGTPSFFINGRLFSGGLSYEQLKVVVDEELAASAGGAAQTAQQ